MEARVKDNKHVIKKAFDDHTLFTASFFIGPLAMTILTTLNMHFLKISSLRKWIILSLGICLTMIYVYSFTLEKPYNVLIMFICGSVLYRVYKQFIQKELLIFNYFIDNSNISVVPYYYGALAFHLILSNLVEVIL